MVSVGISPASAPILQFQKRKHLWVALFVTLQELPGFGLAGAGFEGEALGAHAVDHPEAELERRWDLVHLPSDLGITEDEAVIGRRDVLSDRAFAAAFSPSPTGSGSNVPLMGSGFWAWLGL